MQIIKKEVKEMKEYKRNYAVVKVEEETYKILKELKRNQGVPMTEGIRIAVTNYYGQKNNSR